MTNETSVDGRLIGMARRSAPQAPMELMDEGWITLERGLDGDYRGARSQNRRVTVLARETWEAALAELGDAPRARALPWTTRRANLLVEGVGLPKMRGGLVRIGPVLLEVTYPLQPCARMDEACPGLQQALHPDWRGGVACRVLQGGRVALGETVTAQAAGAVSK